MSWRSELGLVLPTRSISRDLTANNPSLFSTKKAII